jgi:hypothetical protein
MQDVTAKPKFTELSLGTFWLWMKEECFMISEMARRILLPFSTPVYLNRGFSADGRRSPKQGARKYNWYRSESDIAVSLLNGAGRYATGIAGAFWNHGLINVIIYFLVT